MYKVVIHFNVLFICSYTYGFQTLVWKFAIVSISYNALSIHEMSFYKSEDLINVFFTGPWKR